MMSVNFRYPLKNRPMIRNKLHHSLPVSANTWLRRNTTIALTLLLLITVFSLFFSCGYYNPYVSQGPAKTIYIATWKNRTNELQLGTEIYQSLLSWYQRNPMIRVVRNRDAADLVLGGEIVSIDTPSLSYGTNNITREVDLNLQVRYVLKDIKGDTLLFQQPGELRKEEYIVTNDNSTDSTNKSAALSIIIDEMSQDIYTRTLAALPVE